MIAVVYFAFTTLSTVGFGDIKPITNTERMIGSFILLFGVAVFSFIMGNFIEMLMEFKIVTSENEDNANLSKWFGLLARFNKGRPLPKEMLFKIEEYFNYYWANDKNYAMHKESDRRFLSELPKQIRIDVRLAYCLIYPTLWCRFTRISCSRTSCTYLRIISKCSETRSSRSQTSANRNI